MDLSSGDISSMIFKRVVKDGRGDFFLDRQTLAVFMELDGRTTVGVLAKNAGLNMGTMRGVISNLFRLGLIERIEKDIVLLDEDFINYLVAQLSLAIGPIAQVLIEDEVQSFGHDLSQFPSHRVTELVDNLAQEIRREEKKSAFIKNMLHKIRDKGYANL
jgi:hypothetical protein